MARVRCVMMQRDETLLLDPWFRHYGHLFGFENLTVIDNGSTDRHVIETLKTYEQAGSTIIRTANHMIDFHRKGDHAAAVIHHWDQSGSYDFALPVDCDEFLAIFTAEGLSCTRAAIHAHFDSLLGETRALQHDYCLDNVPGRPATFMRRPFRKRFLPAGCVTTIDRGFHALTSSRAEGVRQTDFTYLHMHNKPYPMLIEHARRKLTGFAPIDDPEGLRHHAGEGGAHLIEYLLMSEVEYDARFASGLALRLPGVINHWRALGIREPFMGTAHSSEPAFPVQEASILHLTEGVESSLQIFSCTAYLDLNPDVAAAGMPALKHYLYFGLPEGRPFRVSSDTEVRS